MPWALQRIALADDFRREGGPRVWKDLSGAAGLTMEFAADGWPTGPPIDVVVNPNYNLLNPLFQLRLARYPKAAFSCSTWALLVPRTLWHSVMPRRRLFDRRLPLRGCTNSQTKTMENKCD